MIILLLLLGVSSRALAQPCDSLVVAFWNVENFFGFRSENKPQYWTKRRFYRKCDAIAKTLLRIADRFGRVPSTLPLRASAPKHLPDSAGGVMATRDILLAEFDSLAILVNHHPSQLGGKDDRRAAARSRLRALTDSLHAAGVRRTLAIGDFNEDLWGQGGGTIKYNGGWEKIDGGFADGFSRVREEVFADPLLLVPDAAFGGQKPRRTFVGPRYTGGVSDHLPIVFVLYF